VVLDGVFNHTGRRFFAFEDIMRNGRSSQYADWYFLEEGTSGYGDAFRYRSWEGHEGLPILNHANPAVRQHLFDVAAFWLGEVRSAWCQELSPGGAESSLGDAKSSLGDAKSSLGDAKSSLGDAES
jgi:hypothetical protein